MKRRSGIPSPDQENPEWTDEAVASAQPAREVLPELFGQTAAAEMLVPRRGRPPALAPKQAVSLRLDPDVLAEFRATGPGWQTRINLVLREWLNAQRH
ncbi:hypothetical protein A167_01349 [Alcanivorax sp. S71-1-4]|uniref:BrnA antitoxin family protein n=1 Tax=Alcanivorax sp. S71-1-4 TaxID=1177159 RepID=UPI0013590830|nr:BrnA antitoxin family protein [Alcanivorax sp. S71-1-4]KAF0809809.1 hypothetical protein A167_01349 [Alcanivorax sp. S71-1-4]